MKSELSSMHNAPLPNYPSKEIISMSDLDIKALEANFKQWKDDRAPNFTADQAFLYFSVEQVLKDCSLSDEEIESGILDGSDDGGIDAFYFLINRTLMQEETEVPNAAIEVQLYVVQSKNESGFKEAAITKIHDFMRDLLAFSKPIDSFIYLNEKVRDAMRNFRVKYTSILASPHNFRISFNYATRADDSINPKVQKRVENLKAFVKEQLSIAEIEFNFLGCLQLLNAARTAVKQRLTLKSHKYFTTTEGSIVCLVGLKDFAEFLTDERGGIRNSLLEPNVRAYQGNRNPVNMDIRSTLKTSDSPDFWWLNNGITILSASSSITGDIITIDKPEIVNGLQTSQEIYTYFSENRNKPDSRSLLLRIIVPPEEQVRNKITKATNFQTQVNPASLHATEKLHFDIEDRLKLYNFFYDRRKGYYRNQRKPISRIISMHDLARCVLSIYLCEPSAARGGVQKFLNKQESYKKIFDDKNNISLYVVCIQIDKHVVEYLQQQNLKKDALRNLRYYIDMVLACHLTQSEKPTSKQIADLISITTNTISKEVIDLAFTEVNLIYQELGGDDKVAKGGQLLERLKAQLKTRFKKVIHT